MDFSAGKHMGSLVSFSYAGEISPDVQSPGVVKVHPAVHSVWPYASYTCKHTQEHHPRTSQYDITQSDVMWCSDLTAQRCSQKAQDWWRGRSRSCNNHPQPAAQTGLKRDHTQTSTCLPVNTTHGTICLTRCRSHTWILWKKILSHMLSQRMTPRLTSAPFLLAAKFSSQRFTEVLAWLKI